MKIEFQLKGAAEVVDAKVFKPVEGTFTCSDTEAHYIPEVEYELERQLTERYGFRMNVELFHEDGHAVVGDIPGYGTVIAVRRRWALDENGEKGTP